MALLDITDSLSEPFTPDWRASRELIAALTGLLVGKQPRTILEFGPGLSTVLFSQYLKSGSARLIVVDEPGPYHEKLIGVLETSEMFSSACQILKVPAGKEAFYRLAAGSAEEEHLLALRPYDMIVVDGPGSSTARDTPEARDILASMSDQRTIFVVDDSNRAAESRLVEYLACLRPGYGTAVIRDGRFRHRTSAIIFPFHN